MTTRSNKRNNEDPTPLNLNHPAPLPKEANVPELKKQKRSNATDPPPAAAPPPPAAAPPPPLDVAAAMNVAHEIQSPVSIWPG